MNTQFLVLAGLIVVMGALLGYAILAQRGRLEFIKEWLESMLSHNDKSLQKMEEILGKATQESKEQIEKNQEIFLQVLSKQESLKENLNEMFEKLQEKVEKKLDKISDKVDDRLKDGFGEVNTLFQKIITNVAAISQAQKSIEKLSSEVVSLQNIFNDKKSRGIFGEMLLENTLRAVFGDNKEFYELQFNIVIEGKKVTPDAVIKMPTEPHLLAVDSKFPQENYQRMQECEDKTQKERYKKDFEKNIKKHINDIASKYIIPNITVDYAIMYLPAESLYAEIYANFNHVVTYAYEKRVLIAGPTTLLAILNTVKATIRDYKTQEYAKEIQRELKQLSDNFKRYKNRWEILVKDIEKVSKDVEALSTTSEKISQCFDDISNVKIENLDQTKQTLPLNQS